jgi:hypothetical protein
LNLGEIHGAGECERDASKIARLGFQSTVTVTGFRLRRSACIGEDARRFFSGIVASGEKSSAYTVHFATAREAFIWFGGEDGRRGSERLQKLPLQAIMNENAARTINEATSE